MRAVSWAFTETFDGIKAALNFTLDHLAHAFERQYSRRGLSTLQQHSQRDTPRRRSKTLNGEITAARTDLENCIVRR